MEKAEAKVDQQYEEARIWANLPLRTISWQQALSLLREKNTDLRTARSTIEKAERNNLSVYTDMIPGLSYYGYFTRTLSELTDDFNSREMKSNVNVTFNLPTLTQVPYRVYAAKAETYSAIKAKEGKERELASKLYKIVRMREIDLKFRGLEDSSPSKESALLSQHKQNQEDEKHWQEVAALLGDYSARWMILPETMPHVRWRDYESKMGKLDPLVACQFALQLEKSRMAMYGVALSYLPTIDTNLYSPSLFTSYGGTYQGSFLNADDMQLNLSISYSLDTRLSTWNRYKTSKEDYENTCVEVHNRVIEHKNKLNQLKKSVFEYDNWRGYMRKRMDYVRETPAVTAEEFLLRSSTLLDMERELLTQERQAVESEAALVLEYGMPAMH